MKTGFSMLESLIAEYAALESRVRDCIQQIAGSYCRQCRKKCCRPDICAETIGSPFLTLVRETNPPAASYRSRRGWLATNGCALRVGRPPVCYAFFCNALCDAFNPGAQAQRLLDTGRILDQVGKNAIGTRHLVELQSREELARVRPERLKIRIEKANALLDAWLR